MNSNAFTILELLIVISVLTILTAIAIPRFKGMQEASYIVQAKEDLKTLQAAIESYKTSTGHYPAYNNPNVEISTLSANYLLTASPKIIPNVLYDPFRTSTEYSYMVGSTDRYYAVWSAGSKRDTYVSIDFLSSNGTLCLISEGPVIAASNGAINDPNWC